jgi:hypothetical protein
MDDRQWAIGLTQDVFEREYLKRVPGADVIPDVREWATDHEPVYHGIDGMRPEDLTVDGPAKEPEPVVVQKNRRVPLHLQKKPQGYACRGCGRLFDYSIARAGHERTCKSVIPVERGGANAGS